MNKPIHEENYKGYHIAIYQDIDPESPASWGEGDVCGWSWHFTVENQHINKNIFGALMKMDGYDEYAGEAGEVRKKFHVFPIDAYVHSGIVLSLHGEGMRDRWDTSDFVGCVLVSKHETKGKTEAEKIAHGIIATWNQYLNGEVSTKCHATDESKQTPNSSPSLCASLRGALPGREISTSNMASQVLASVVLE